MYHSEHASAPGAATTAITVERERKISPMRDTPRTAEFYSKLLAKPGNRDSDTETLLEHARLLERENTNLREALNAALPCLEEYAETYDSLFKDGPLFIAIEKCRRMSEIEKAQTVLIKAGHPIVISALTEDGPVRFIVLPIAK